MKKFTSLFLALLLMFTCTFVSVNAEEESKSEISIADSRSVDYLTKIKN